MLDSNEVLLKFFGGKRSPFYGTKKAWNTPKRAEVTGNHLLFFKTQLKLQSFTKYLRQALVFMWNSALPEKFDLCFSGDFYRY